MELDKEVYIFLGKMPIPVTCGYISKKISRFHFEVKLTLKGLIEEKKVVAIPHENRLYYVRAE
jgi:hypothetical protein